MFAYIRKITSNATNVAIRLKHRDWDTMSSISVGKMTLPRVYNLAKFQIKPGTVLD